MREWITEGDLNFKLVQEMANDQETTILLLSGFDDCLLGTAEQEDGLVAVYSVSQCIDSLAESMSKTDALEYFHFNVVRSVEYQDSASRPILCWDETEVIEYTEAGEGEDNDAVPPPSDN